MRKIDESEAQRTLDDLLDQLERGAQIVITRDGWPVARLITEPGRHDRLLARKAAAGIRELANSINLGAYDWQEWKNFRDQGRR